MKLVHFTNQLPPEDCTFFRELRRRSKTKGHTFLQLFLQEASQALRAEICRLPPERRSLFPPFENILDLAEVPSLRRGPLGECIEGLLLCTLHLGLFIVYFEEQPQDFTFDKLPACITVQGYARLAGAAILVSPTLENLASAGAEAICMALRLGLVIEETSKYLEAPELENPPESWAALIDDIDEKTAQEELDSFNISTHSPTPSKIFISVVGDQFITVSGPPTRLRMLFRVSEKLRYSKFRMLPIHGGLGHAPHVYDKSHCLKIVETINPAVACRPLVDTLSMYSSADGVRITAGRAAELFEKMVSEILLDTIRWPKVFDSVVDSILASAATELHVHFFRTSPLIEQLMTTVGSRAPSCNIKSIDLVSWVESPPSQTTPRGTADDKIAIVGMSCRFPGGANDTELFWNLLHEGRDVHTKVPADRYDVESHTDATGKTRNTCLTPFGCFIDQPGLFDAGFFNMSPREAAQTDPMARLAIVTAYEALEQSGFVPERTTASRKARVSTFYGQASDDYREVNSAQDVDTYYITGGCRAFAPGRINYFFKFSGPSFSCDTACSSSLATIQIACTSLLHGDADTAIAGGLNVLTNSDPYAGLSRGHFLSKTGGCKTWDCNADGYCRADGVGSVVLKRLVDAEADNDNILGIILASATNHSADAISITHPHASTQSELYRRVMNRAGVDPMDVDYVEFHGTGTQAGDTTEMESVMDVFGPETPRRVRPLHIGAVKGNVGHGEAAAGIMALIKVLLMFQKNTVPRHVGIRTVLNPNFPNLSERNVKIPYEETVWPRQADRKRYAIVNNFSAAGGNTTLLVEEPPIKAHPQSEDPRSAMVVTLSAKGKTSLKKNLENMISHLGRNPGLSLADLSYTTTARRMHHTHRIAITGSSISDIVTGLQKRLATVEDERSVPSHAPSVAFAFSGQGTFYPGIGRMLFKTHPDFRAHILQLEAICIKHGFPTFLSAITGEVNEGHVFEPIITQLTIVCVGIALARLLGALGVKPNVVVGASLGDYAALCVAGVLSASDAIFLAGVRAQILQDQCTPHTHTMLAVRGTPEQLREAAEGRPFELCCVNGYNEVCIGGPTEEILDLRVHLEGQGFKCFQLNVPFSFHSSQMDPVISPFEVVAEGATFKAPNIPFLSSLMHEVVFDGKTVNAKYMSRATRETMHLFNALDQGHQMGLIDKDTVWVDIGPHPICLPFVRGLTPDVAVTTGTLRRDEDNWRSLSETLAQLHCVGVDIDWNEWHKPFEANLRLIDLPAYGWNEKNYWMQYNGTWMLTKDQAPSITSHEVSHHLAVPSTLRTSLIHEVIEEVILETSGRVVVRCDLMRPEFYAAVDGHRMNGCGIITASIHADIGFTLGRHLYARIRPRDNIPGVNVTKLEVVQAVVARKDKSRPQWIQISAVADLAKRSAQLKWYFVHDDGSVAEETFATAVVQYGDVQVWLDEWAPQAHLIASRVEVLDRLADEGLANRFTRDMAYLLFDKLVDYSEKYRGMHSVVLHGMEATASVILTPELGGTWTVPPHHIDSIIHLSGFILNGGYAVDNRNNFFVTPGWKSLRFAKSLEPGVRYRTYVRMAPASEPGFFVGDVYLLQDCEVIGVCGGMKFRGFPRLLLGKFFSPPDGSSPGPVQPHGRVAKPVEKKVFVSPTASSCSPPSSCSHNEGATSQSTPPSLSSPKIGPAAIELVEGPSRFQDAMELIAAETEVDVRELTMDTVFAAIGVDSLLALVLSERFKERLGISVPSSIFLECPTIKDLQSVLLDYC